MILRSGISRTLVQEVEHLTTRKERGMAYVDPRLRGQAVPVVSVNQMEREHVARLRTLRGSEVAFVDQKIPGYQREIINIIGMSVTENVTEPALAPKIKAPAHGFAVTYIRNTPKGHGAALHRHPTEEVFIALKGPWSVFWLEGETEREVILQPGDTVSVPIGVYRGFRNASDDPDATLIAIIGGPDTGKVDWHPTVIEEARRTGLSVDDEGNLVIANAAE
jgi:quercetin dioxygenase-like cupin family protein